MAIDIRSAGASLVVVGNLINRNKRGISAFDIAVNAIVSANNNNKTRHPYYKK